MTSIHSLHHDHSYIWIQHRIRTVAALQILLSWSTNDLVKGNVNIHSSSLKYYYNFPVISRINYKYLDLIFKSPSFLGTNLLHKYHTTTVASRHVASHSNITFSYIECPSQSPFFQTCCPPAQSRNPIFLTKFYSSFSSQLKCPIFGKCSLNLYIWIRDLFSIPLHLWVPISQHLHSVLK